MGVFSILHPMQLTFHPHLANDISHPWRSWPRFTNGTMLRIPISQVTPHSGLIGSDAHLPDCPSSNDINMQRDILTAGLSVLVHRGTLSPGTPGDSQCWYTGGLSVLVHRGTLSPGTPGDSQSWYTGGLSVLVHRGTLSPGTPGDSQCWYTGGLSVLVHRGTLSAGTPGDSQYWYTGGLSVLVHRGTLSAGTPGDSQSWYTGTDIMPTCGSYAT